MHGFKWPQTYRRVAQRGGGARQHLAPRHEQLLLLPRLEVALTRRGNLRVDEGVGIAHRGREKNHP